MSALPAIGPRHFAHFALLPAVVLFERMSYYGGRSMIFIVLLDVLGLESTEVSAFYTMLSVIGIGTPLIGGILAALVGPYAVLLLGSLVTAAALFGVSLGDPETMQPLLLVSTVAVGVLKPAVWTIAAVQLTRTHLFGRIALFAALYMAVNLGAVAGSLTTALFGDELLLGFAAAGGVGLLVPVLTGVLWFVGHGQTWPEPELPDGLTAAGVAFATALLCVPFWALTGIASDAGFTAAQNAGASFSSIGWMQTLNPVMVLVGGVFAVLGCGAAQLFGLRVPDLVFAGVALMGASIGAFAMHPASVGVLGLTGIGAGTVALGLSEVVVMPIVMARIGGDSHWRLVPVFIALWQCASYSVSWVATFASAAVGAGVAVPAAAFVTGVAGLLLIGGAIAAREHLLPVSAAPAEEAQQT